MKYFFIFMLSIFIPFQASFALDARWPEKTYYRTASIDGQQIFYREAGKRTNPTIVLLHGYPSSSHTYRELIPLLSGYFHIIAPDNLGSGYSSKPDSSKHPYSFDVLAEYTDKLLTQLKIDKYSVYMQDFGAPVGFRLMMKNPDKVVSFIAQNANAYLEGIPKPKQQFFINAQLDKSNENIKRLFNFTSEEAVKYKQYLRDVKGKEEIMSPDSWTHDALNLQQDSNRRIQVQLFQDYKTNLDFYPVWQKFMRKRQYPALIVWGKNDPVFTATGAKAYLKDNPKAKLHLVEAGHFAVEENPVVIAKQVIQFMSQFK